MALIDRLLAPRSPVARGFRLARVERAVADAKAFAESFEPDLVVLFHPDHYNGFFYKEMPPFCLATAADAVGDFDSQACPLPVPTDLANRLAQGVLDRGVLDRGVDLTVSARMTVDHGAVQPLEVLFGGIGALPVIPVYINGVATPLGPLSRIRALGAAIGEACFDLDQRVLFLASGGLSHDPPVPVLDGAPPHVAEALIEGIAPTPEQRVIDAGRAYDGGETSMIPINPAWDNALLDILENGALPDVDGWTVEWMNAEGGHSSHEVRTWIAAFSALDTAAGTYEMTSRFYEAIPEWIAGFATATAGPAV